MKLNWILVGSLALLSVGCNEGNTQVIEQAGIQGRATAEADLRVNNENLAAKAVLMEADLALRHRFYQAVRGTYEGTLSTDRGEFKVRITLVPSLPPHASQRTRQLEEITSDFNNLFFNAQIVQWNPQNTLSAVGCQVENIRPDITRGHITIAAASCPNLYALTISDEELARNVADTELGAAVSTEIREGRIVELPMIQGQVLPTTNAAIYHFTVNRVRR